MESSTMIFNLDMDIESLILKELKNKKELKVADIVKATGFSRAYISRMFKKIKDENKIIQIGKANKAKYVFVGKDSFDLLKKQVLKSKKALKNKNLSESDVLENIKKETGIFLDMPENISTVLDYAFTEILNNAIEHSKSKKIITVMERKPGRIIFEIIDFGIGIFKNVMKKRNLKNELEAIQDILKGKQTTAPKEHTGEGLFFTSKASDKLIIRSFGKKLIIDNVINDIFIEDIRPMKGTAVKFEIEIVSPKNLNAIFRKYSEEAFSFDKTEVAVDLYTIDNLYISRSQARRILSGLDKFRKIILDFKNIKTVGQAFADEVFRVWKDSHKDIDIIYKNANENIVFMIERAKIENRI